MSPALEPLLVPSWRSVSPCLSPSTPMRDMAWLHPQREMRRENRSKVFADGGELRLGEEPAVEAGPADGEDVPRATVRALHQLRGRWASPAACTGVGQLPCGSRLRGGSLSLWHRNKSRREPLARASFALQKMLAGRLSFLVISCHQRSPALSLGTGGDPAAVWWMLYTLGGLLPSPGCCGPSASPALLKMYVSMNYSHQCFAFSCSFPVWPPLGLLLFLGTHSWGADIPLCV